jgi:hypothetical protein
MNSQTTPTDLPPRRSRLVCILTGLLIGLGLAALFFLHPCREPTPALTGQPAGGSPVGVGAASGADAGPVSGAAGG